MHLRRISRINVLECLIKSFRKFALKKKQTYPNCSTPWHESMLENKNYFNGNSTINSCNEEGKQKQVRMDTSFIKYSLTSKDAKCKGNTAKIE